MKKIAALVLALLMMVPLCVSCVNPGESGTTTASSEISTNAPEVTDSKYDANGFLKDTLPSLNFNNEEITILMWDNHTMTEFYDDSESGDFIGEAINARNAKVEERLGVKLKFVPTPGASTSEAAAYIKKALADAQTSPSEYDIFATYSRTPPAMSIQGLCTNLLETEYFNVDMPWWPDALMKECTINNKLYFCSGDISTNLLWMMIATFFNEKLVADYQFAKTPYQLVNDNEWTFDKMAELTKDIYEDNGDSRKNSEDKFGYVIYEVNIDAFQTAADIISIDKDESGSLVVSPSYYGEKQIDMVSKVSNFMSSQGVYHANSTSVRQIFFEQRAIMITDRVFIVAGKDNGDKSRIEFDYGIVPQPKYSADQDRFVTNVGHPFTMYAIASYSDNIEICSALLEAMGSENYRSITPKVFESAMKIRYASGAEAGKMYDIIREGISFDLGRLFCESFGNHTANLFRKTALAGAPFASNYAAAKSTIQNGHTVLENAFD